MSISGLGDEPPDEPAPRPDHVYVIRNALRLAADNAYPDDNAKPYQETLAALTVTHKIAVVDAKALRAVLDGSKVSLEQWRLLDEAAKEGK